MDHSSSSFYSILIEPLKFAPTIEIDDIRHRFSTNSSDISELSPESRKLDSFDCDWENGLCENWSSSLLIENLSSKFCFKRGKILIAHKLFI